MSKNRESFLKSMMIKDLKVTLGKENILKGVNLNINSGELLALIGQNGAGKSTLLKTILGETAYTGAVSFNYDKNDRKVRIGYVPQKLDFDASSPISVLDIFSTLLTKMPVCFYIKRALRNKVVDYLSLFKAEDLIDKKIGFLSGGELQRVLLALALYNKPDILLLDEPVSGIDVNGLKIFYDLLVKIKEKYGLLIILITHDLKMLKSKADKIAFLHNGVIESIGTGEEVFKDSKVYKGFGICQGEDL